MNSLYTYLLVSAILFCLGLYGVTTRRNALLILMSIELILSSANINLVAFSRFGALSLDGQIFALFAIVIALVQAAVGIAIILNVYNTFRTINIDKLDISRNK
ncbi:MAG: NADH-quinone oxidoreductase subunit NuoK [Candidatus Marinimicrobia bacterium]|nr:NADH-quinone oxidoreductase subunit NuoK [Candidatus Neomarinimicrobiota bacterium]